MSATVSACTIAAYISATETGAAGDLSAGTPRDGFTISNNSSNATAAVQMSAGTTGAVTSVNVIGSALLSLTGAAEELDLRALVTLLGTKTFAKVRGLIFHNEAAAASGFNVTITAGATNGITPFLTGTTPGLIVPPQGTFLLLNPQIAGWTCDSTHKTLKFDPGANTVNFQVGIVGE